MLERMKSAWIGVCILMGCLAVSATVSRAAELPAGMLANLRSEEFRKRESAQAELLAWSRNQPESSMDELLRHSREDGDPEVRQRCLDVLKELVNDEYLEIGGEGFLGVQMGNGILLGVQGVQGMQEESVMIPGDPVRRKVVKVTLVLPDSAAKKAGLQADDQIVQMGDLFWHEGDPGDASTILRERIRRLKPNTRISLKILRDGKLMDIEVKLGRRPPNADMMLFGGQQFDAEAAERAAKDAYFRRWLEGRSPRK